MLGPQPRQHPHRLFPRILNERSRDHLHGFGNSLIRPLLHALDCLGHLRQPHGHRHLRRSAPGRQPRVEHDVSGDGHGVLKVAFDFVEDVFGGPAQQDGACFWDFAVGDEGEVFVADFLDLEEAALGAHVGFLQVVDPVDDGGSGGAGDAVVVCFADAAKGGDVVFDEEVLGEV